MHKNKPPSWTTKDDIHLIENVHKTDDEIGSVVLRTPNAVRYRRGHLAIMMHTAYPERPLEVCVDVLGADPCLVESLMVGDSKNYQSVLTDMARLTALDQLYHAATSQVKVKRERDFTIDDLCEEIRRENGRLGKIWDKKELVPCLVEHYPGLHAYAQHILQS